MPADTPGATSPSRMTLWADTAADLMAPVPLSIRASATVREAVVLFTDRGVGAAAVTDEAGRPVGVITQSDLLAHEREKTSATEEPPVSAVMTPAVFSVRPETEAAKVVEQMLALNVHRLFVVDGSGVLLGVIGTSDVLRKLHV